MLIRFELLSCNNVNCPTFHQKPMPLQVPKSVCSNTIWYLRYTNRLHNVSKEIFDILT
jgi:hypothetical protein